MRLMNSFHAIILALIIVPGLLAQTDTGTATLVPTEPQPPTSSDVATGTSATSLDKVAEAGFSIGRLDFSDARLSLAGPSALYIRSVKVDGIRVSLLFRKDGDEQWKLVETVPEEKNYFPTGTVLDFARLNKLDNGSLEIDGIVLDGKPYRTVVKMNDDNSLSLDEPLQAGTFIGASLSRAKPTASLALKDEIDTLNKKYDETERINQEMLAKIGNLEGVNRNSSEEKVKLQDQLKELEDRNTALNTEVSALQDEIDTYKSSAENGDNAAASSNTTDQNIKKSLAILTSSLDKLQGKISGLDQKIDRLTNSAGTNGTGNSTNIGTEVKRLSDLNEQLMAERQDLEQNLRAQFLSSGYIKTMKPLLGKSILNGFSRAVSKVGNWNVSSDKAVQPDPGQYFAQLNLPLVQKRTTMLYHFSARSTGKHWVGLGLHIYAGDSRKKGYGHGKSLLVWLTRDPDYYKNNQTHLQLYKSDTDINMGRVLDSAIQESISDKLEIDVLYQPEDEYITVAINGIEKIRYKTWFGLTDGVEVALRSLDTAEFSTLQVWSADK